MSLFKYGVAISFIVACGSVYAQTYTPIPPNFDFPAPQARLLAARDSQNVDDMRRHAWMVFAGMTQPARPQDPTSEAVWETWYRGSEVFATGAQPEAARRLRRELVTPRQFQQRRGAAPQAVGLSLASSTLFNQETKDHIRDPQNKYFLRSALETLNASFPANGPVENRKIKDFPAAAMSLKAVWVRINSTGLTPLPVWDPDKQQMNDPAPPQNPGTWKRRVLVDPSRDQIPDTETRDIPGFPGAHVVSLGRFYHFKVAQDQVAALQSFGAQAGDFMALVALHYTTKEIPDWVWATFWWHDKPNDGPFAKGRPDATQVKGPWRDYLMDVSYDMTTPREADGKPNACFNPWLEAGFSNGVRSNCMTCHQQSVWEKFSFLPITRGPKAPNDPLFRDTTRLDFVWAFTFEGPGQQ